MGNICRSPAAEGIFIAKANQAGLNGGIECDSAGTIGYHSGERADARMRAAASRRGYQLESRSRRVQPSDFEDFDHIIAMDRDNLGELEVLARRHPGKARLSLMCEYARGHDDEEVPDPYYGGEQGFEHVLDLLEDACDGLLGELRKSTTDHG
jgi:protein-tyrosine phosphatase